MVAVDGMVAPFGSSSKRFGPLRGHPGLDPSGLYVARPVACDPCLYSPQPLNEIFKVNKRRSPDKNPWRYKAEVEEWSQNLGYRNQKVLEQKAYLKSILGAAWHHVTWPAGYSTACKNVGFGRTPRTRPSKNYIPGPGSYYRAQPFKTPYGPHSSRATLDREEPCRFNNGVPKWSLAPNRYTIFDKESIEYKPKKMVSLRGPYDLFTGRRDGSTIKNHFNTSMKVYAETWPIALKGTLDKYDKSKFGTMNKTGRDVPHTGRSTLMDLAMCRRRADDPSAAHYPQDLSPRVWAQNKRGFNSSYDRAPGYQRQIVWPAVGRYSPEEQNCGIPGYGHRHVFLSKVDRTIGAILPQPMNSF